MCEVIDVIPYKRSYRLANSIMTDRALLVAIGTSQQTVKITNVSESRLTDKEYRVYMRLLLDQYNQAKANGLSEADLAKLKPPSKWHLKLRRRTRARATKFNYSQDDINKMLDKKAGKQGLE